MQGPAQKGHAAPDGLSAGQAGNGLVHHRLKNRGGQVGLGGPFVDQGLNVRFGKNTAAGGNGVNLLIVLRLPVQLPRVNLQQGRHLVNKGAGASGADAVHPLFQTTGKINDFGILAPQLNGHIGLGIILFKGPRHGHHFLNEADAHGLGQGNGTGASDPGLHGARPQLLPGILQKLRQGPLGIGLVAGIIAINQPIFLVQHRKLHRCGADINSCAIGIHSNFLSVFCQYLYADILFFICEPNLNCSFRISERAKKTAAIKTAAVQIKFITIAQGPGGLPVCSFLYRRRTPAPAGVWKNSSPGYSRSRFPEGNEPGPRFPRPRQ